MVGLSGAAGGVAAIVLAGGESRRFGSDKLVADLDGRPVLEHALDGLPAGARIAVVGPARPTDRAVTFLREDPPGGGPAAGLITGLVWALGLRAQAIVVLPGDAPGAGRATSLLLAALAAPPPPLSPPPPVSPPPRPPLSPPLAESPESTAITAAVGTDATGREQVLQLALLPSAARSLVEAAGPNRGQGESVRRLLAALTPAPQPVPLPEELTDDIDTIDHLRQARAARSDGRS